MKAKAKPPAKKKVPAKTRAKPRPAAKPKTKRIGRPSTYTEAIADEICERLSNQQSLRQICEDAKMPDRRTVDRWADENPAFAAKRARAREAQADAIFDDMADIEEKTLKGKLGAAAARAVLSSKQWRASKLAPKKFGDKVTTEVTGKDGGPIETRDMSDAERAVRLAAFLAKNKAAK